MTLPAVAVNLILLHNNKVLFYQDGATPTVWDYMAGTFNNHSCGARSFLLRACAAGGRKNSGGRGIRRSGNTIGISNAEIFDPVTLTWTAVPNMQYRRWYPNATTLSDGRDYCAGRLADHRKHECRYFGNLRPGCQHHGHPSRTPTILLKPIHSCTCFRTGDSSISGARSMPTDTDVLDLNTTSWSVVDSHIVDGGSATMYLPGKFMKAGSATDSQDSGPSSNTTFVLDMTQPSPAWQQTASMAYPRSFMNLTMLPDGNVLATGGETDKNGGTIANAVYAAEMWSPTTQTWTTMASMHTPREYHGTALLLPDGRVLESGMGADFGNVPDESSAEFYSPPYLFKGARPTYHAGARADTVRFELLRGHA